MEQRWNSDPSPIQPIQEILNVIRIVVFADVNEVVFLVMSQAHGTFFVLLKSGVPPLRFMSEVGRRRMAAKIILYHALTM